MKEKNIFDVLVIGAGPAGLTAALYGARSGMKTLVVAGENNSSQMTLTDSIENYPGFPEGIAGYDLLEKFQQQVSSLGVEILQRDALSVRALSARAEDGGNDDGVRLWEVTLGEQDDDEHLEYQTSHTLIIATGAMWRRLGIEGEEKFLGRGVSFCATCDGPLYRNKEVLVVGGGDAALQEALFLADFTKKVTLIHRRSRLRASDILQQRALANPKIEFILNARLLKIKGDKTVSSVTIKDNLSSKTMEIPTSGVFVFIGFVPNTGFLEGLLELSPSKAIIVDERMRTSASGIFAAGDCTEKSLRQVVTACGDGAIAAQQAQHFIEELEGRDYPPREPFQ